MMMRASKLRRLLVFASLILYFHARNVEFGIGGHTHSKLAEANRINGTYTNEQGLESCSKSCAVQSWNSIGGLGNQYPSMYKNFERIMAIGCCIVPPLIFTHHGHGWSGQVDRFDALFSVSALQATFPGFVSVDHAHPMEFCSCMRDNLNPYEARSRMCPGSCEDVVMNVTNFAQWYNQTQGQPIRNLTAPIPLMIMNSDLLIEIDHRMNGKGSRDFDDAHFHTTCWARTSYQLNLTNALSHGGSMVERKKHSLESKVKFDDIHGTIHVRLGDYKKHCGRKGLARWDGCYPHEGWETWYHQILRACTASGVLPDETCRVYAGTEGDISGLAVLGCSGSPRIEFVCEGCASQRHECLTIIPFEPFSLHGTNTDEIESTLSWTKSSNAGSMLDQLLLYNKGRGFFIGNYYSSFSAMVWRMRFMESLKVGTFNTSKSLNAAWAPRTGIYKWPNIVESNSTCEAWPNRFDMFSKESDVEYITSLSKWKGALPED